MPVQDGPALLPMMPASVQIKVLRIALVCAENEMGRRLAAGLEARGHQVIMLSHTEAGSLREAVPPPDAVVWHLNHQSAAAAATLLDDLRQTAAPEMAVIALTDQPEAAARVEAWLKRGIIDFLPLPMLGGSDDALAARLAIVEHSLFKRREQAFMDANAVSAVQRYEEV
ncbi:MAG: hypothetical protein JWL81_2219, partial [Verrucomicrobiales bacterium]|nr:hypothetical protein [Verrucomicrobiales bacterium]